MEQEMKVARRLVAEEKGLTLIEIMAVILLIALIIAVFGGGIFEQAEGARADLNVAKMDMLGQKLSLYKLKFGKYPDRLEHLLTGAPDIQDKGQIFTPLVTEEEDLQDVWGTDYLYKSENNGRNYSLSSYGSNGTSGGEGAAQDVTKKG